jgi:uncharacterized C2H2 Zn-finger protein
MPKTEVDYSNTIIYKIACKDVSCKELYVGFTTNFIQKKYTHKQCCTNEQKSNYNSTLYETIRGNGGWENWSMEMIGSFNCKNRAEAKKKEEEFCHTLNATLNAETSIFEKPFQKNTAVYKCDVDDSENKIIKHTDSNVKNLFICEDCDFKCSHKRDYDRHIMTIKHQFRSNDNKNNKNDNKITTKKPTPYKISLECPKCLKIFNDRSGLWRHTKKYHTTQEEYDLKDEMGEDFDLKSIFLEMMKQNEEFKKIMVDQNTKMMELASSVNTNITSITNNNNVNNTMNNKFNLQIFLNETCKDAMNIQEFIDYVKVQHSDFENFGKYGYVESMTRIIMRNLMELEVHRRPIHCTDVKREVLYVKDNNVWVNDFSREKLIRAIKYIAAKNVKQIPGWMDHNPDSKNTQTKLHDKYMRMVCHSMGGRDEAEDQEYYKKIIHNLAKEVVIDKMK